MGTTGCALSPAVSISHDEMQLKTIPFVTVYQLSPVPSCLSGKRGVPFIQQSLRTYITP
jgi:hypothetical protein